MNEQYNERILELAKQAGLVKILDQHASEYGCGMFENTHYTELGKFAELIVRECAKVLEIKGAETGQEPYYYSASLIEEHFGVEE